MTPNKTDSKACKKAKFKKRIFFLLASLVIAGIMAIVVCALLLYRPAYYNPPDFVNGKEVSPYLTHDLSPQFYNGVQMREPFDLYVSQEGINDVIGRSKWPRETDGIRFSAPEVFFVPERIMLVGTAAVGEVEFVVTVVAEPAFDEDGLLNLRVGKVRIGAVNITPIARMVARRVYQRRRAEDGAGAENLRAKIAASILNNEAFEPVFEVEDKKVRAEKITISEGSLKIHLRPVLE